MHRNYRSSRHFSIVLSIVYHAKPVKFVWFIVEVVFHKFLKLFFVLCILQTALRSTASSMTIPERTTLSDEILRLK